MKIQVLGSGCPKCKTLTERVEEAVADLGLELIIDETPVPVTLASGLVGRVASMDPPSGSEVTINDAVRVGIGALQQFEVPNLVGMTQAEAQAALTSLGLQLDVLGEIQVDPNSGLVGRVAGQFPEAGALVDEGSAITVQVGVAPATTTTTAPPTTTTTQPPGDG